VPVGRGLEGRVFSARVLLGIAGFAVGGLPFWLWNAGHEWQSFGMQEGLRPCRLGDVPGLIWPKYVKLHGLRHCPAWLAHLVHVLHVAVPAGGLIAGGVVAVRRRTVSDRMWYAAYAFLFAVLLLAAYCSSSFAKMNTARYFTPFAPAFAVMAAFAVGLCGKRKVLPAVVVVPIITTTPARGRVCGRNSRLTAVPCVLRWK